MRQKSPSILRAALAILTVGRCAESLARSHYSRGVVPREIDWVDHYGKLTDTQLQALTRSWPRQFSDAAWAALSAEWSRRNIPNPHPDRPPLGDAAPSSPDLPDE